MRVERLRVQGEIKSKIVRQLKINRSQTHAIEVGVSYNEQARRYMDFLTFAEKNIVLLDGALGTRLQQRGLEGGALPERLNVTAPEIVESVHREYIESGANVVYTNTFGANRLKLGTSEETATLVKAGVEIARRAAGNRAYVALDIGPSGALLEPLGDLSFDDAYDLFKEQVEAGRDGVDLVVIETMSDLYELKAAALAVRENCNLPLMCSMTFDENGRTFTGCSVEAFALTASAYCDFIGINCSLGPDKIFQLVKRLMQYTDLPVFVKANAGLPDSNMNYSVSAEQFVSAYADYLDAGVNVLGGCCGTTPEYIAGLKKLIKGRKPAKRERKRFSAVCSAEKVVVIDGVKVIGERINPTGKKAMKQALVDGNFDYIASQVLEQVEAGAEILDVNCGLPQLDETAMLSKLVPFVQSLTDAPLQIDCGKPDAVEAALRRYNGKAIVNSVTAEDSSLDALLPIVKKYGAAVVGLTVGANGVPQTVEERVTLASKIVERAKSYGIPEEDIFIDCLTLTVSAEQAQAMNTLHAIERVKSMYNVKTVLGVSNISFGLPARQLVNTAFLTMAMYAGLDLPILNPNIAANMQAVDAFNVLHGNDEKCAVFTAKYADWTANAASVTNTAAANAQTPQSGAADRKSGESDGKEQKTDDIFYCISKGLPRAKDITAALLANHDGITVIDEYLIPALNKVGDDYEKGVIFLPQLIASAEAAKLCFDEVKKTLPDTSAAEKGKIVLATVKGDVHDIGKNIVKTVLENYGYHVIDLGKNVPPQDVVDACLKHKVRLCGLSALMTTTVENMKITVKQLKEACPDCKVMVGGAVLTEEYAAEIGADKYCKDANKSARYAEEVFGK